ncbi:hypothetical protein BH24ACT1_BH24ACT1_12090 [soil metagenome]
MSTTRRLAAVAMGVFSLLLLTPPASAAERPKVDWTRPTPNGALEEPGAITGTITTRPEDKQTIKAVSFRLVADPPSQDPEDPCLVEQPAIGRTIEGTNAEEDFALKVDFPCNGKYELTATVDYEEPLVVAGVTRTIELPPLRFSVAIPPARVQGLEATYDEATREVRLTWAPNTEVDLLGYLVERDPPGREGFSIISGDLLAADQTSFINPGIEDEHRYRVTAVRRGAEPDSRLSGQPTSSLPAGPERTDPTLPNLPARGSASSPDGGGNQTPAPSRRRPSSNIFEKTLPFDPSRTTIPSTSGEPSGDAAVVAEFEGEPTADRRATLVPIAGGLALAVGAMHLFLLSKRAGEPDDIPMR